jgi:enamine deaminase RidA (YjgF/YER057c/UK114 family)
MEDTMARVSINVGRKHQNPIPNACRIGSLVMSSVIVGTDLETGDLPDDLPSQCTNMFRNMVQIAQTAGGSTDDIIKMTVWLLDLDDRAALNREWLQMFPDPETRPARHALSHVGNPVHRILCDFTMVIGAR